MTRLGEMLGAYQKRDPAARSKLEIFCSIPASMRRSIIAWPIGFISTASNLLPGSFPSGHVFDWY